jgi:hypothetical protein
MILTGDWRKLHHEELHYLYCSLNVIRRTELRKMRWAGHVAGMWGWEFIRTVIRIPEESRIVGRPAVR